MARNVGFIGLGNMGRHMAANLLKAGFELRVFDVVPEAMDDAASLGALTTQSPAEASAGADYVITMLPSSSHVEEVVSGPKGVLDGIGEGKTIVEMSTIQPSVTQRLGQLAAERGVHMLDAPVSRSQSAAIKGELLIMVGGAPEVLKQCLPVLEAMGSTIVHVGPSGMGAVAKLVNNMVVGSIITVTSEALVYGVKAGASLDSLVEVLKNASGNSWLLDNLFPRAFEGNFEPGFFVDHMHKDLGLALASGAELRVPLFMTSLSRELFATVQTKGLGKKDALAILHVLEELAGVEVRK